MTPRRDQLVDEYLRRLDNAAVFLPADRREELRQEIVEHIDAGLEQADAKHAEAVRAVLERLGPPADIVAAELGGPRSTGSTPVVGTAVPDAAVPPVAPAPPAAPVPPAPPAGAPPAPPAPPAPSRRRGPMIAAIGAGAAVLAFGALFLGFAMSAGEEHPGFVGPAPSAPPTFEPTPTDPETRTYEPTPTDPGTRTFDTQPAPTSPTTPPTDAPTEPTASPS
ncbi:hypothetical protein ACFWVF_16645 [Streptomyces sp. NPDC058659]|uniref:HAAS signaling domain-containing protein n=1 Tax=unclassified Streptomyces TaxID=2593676 RepID=UPI0036535074